MELLASQKSSSSIFPVLKRLDKIKKIKNHLKSPKLVSQSSCQDFLSSCKNIILNFFPVRTVFLSSYKHIILVFGLIWTAFLKLFCFNLYNMVDIEYSPGNYKSSKISTESIKNIRKR